FMFFYNGALLMDGTWFELVRAGVTAVVGVFLLSAGVQGWFVGARAAGPMRLGLIGSALFMIEGGLLSDVIGASSTMMLYLIQTRWRTKPGVAETKHPLNNR
ncbi:MAG: TRAP transporter permease, partial [Pseudomonadota bacterium]